MVPGVVVVDFAYTAAMSPKLDDLDALLALGDVDGNEVLAMVPALLKAAGGELPAEARPLLARLARAAGVTERDDEAETKRKIDAFVAAHAPRDDVKRGLFTLAAGKALDLVKKGAQAAFQKFSDADPACPVAPNDGASGNTGTAGKRAGVSALDVRLGKTKE